ncbi:Heat shock protein 70 [Ectocarpus siliculosus]|uniref:Heat shock protein 70 n=1 Tax=Ectocarpus siliculosus TaxID=2880 RepID=D7G6V4_ECTSI|nr:Heat shock protein 70 [Ectocarpus siliculosus]|eukprot:CBJ25647.1 Heat shock protein 70 [Ectocarpus siliculosus]
MAVPETVVAIDFGTTRSAWAYQVSGQADNKILVKIPASADTSPSSTIKTETAALIGGRGSGGLVSFGPAAIEDYAASDHVADQALFRWFKFDLCESRTDQTEVGSVMTESVGGQHTVPLLGVMTASLRYFKEDVLAFLSRTGGRTVDVNSVNWVLTVPAIYDDFAKRFMRQAAYEAGMIDRMNSTRLRLCLEPEAACLAAITTDNPLTSNAEGKNMMVIDCGGGTVDITAHKIISVEPLTLEEVAAPDGGLFGSTRVDNAFRVWLKGFLGEKFQEIETTRTLLSIMMSWERKKATFQGLDSAAVWRLNLSELAGYDVTNQDMENLRRSYNDGKPSSLFVGGEKFNVTLPTTLVTSFFTPTLQKIAECLRRIKRESQLHDLHRVFVVGGFSRCPMLREVIRNGLDLPAGRVVDVHEPDLAIVKGAVMYFDRSTSFNSRKARYTYGTGFAVPFDDSNAEHRRRRAAGLVSHHDGKVHVSNGFSIYIRKGDDIPEGGILKRRRYGPLKKSQTSMSFAVYCTSERNPSFADENGCFEVGRVSFPLDMTKEFQKRGIVGEMTFGGPELTVKIVDHEEREITDAVMIMSRAPAPTY